MRTVPKPWGREEIFAENERYAGKILHLSAGHACRCSTMSARTRRSTSWRAKCCFSKWRKTGRCGTGTCRPGQTYRIRPGDQHRMRAEPPCVILEVSSPELDDVVRLEDAYGRAGTEEAMRNRRSPRADAGSAVGRLRGRAGADADADTGSEALRWFRPPARDAAPTPAADVGRPEFLGRRPRGAHARETVPPPEKGGLTINNQSLVKSSDKGRVSTSKLGPLRGETRSGSHTRQDSRRPTSPSAPASETSAAPATEAQWKEIAAKARKRVADDKARVAELEAATKKLENDFYAWDDGQYRDRVIKPAWDHSRSELDTAKHELADAEKDLDRSAREGPKGGSAPRMDPRMTESITPPRASNCRPIAWRPGAAR